ncbi:MAG: hypothetical protein ACTHMU_23460, partial [Thermomicrobiales bacterium]
RARNGVVVCKWVGIGNCSGTVQASSCIVRVCPANCKRERGAALVTLAGVQVARVPSPSG